MSIRWRLTIFHAATTLVIVVVLVGALFAAIGISVDRAVRETAQARALEAAQIVGASGTLSEADLARLSLNGVVLIVRDERGHVLAQTGDVVGETGAPDLATWHEALQSGRPAEGHVSLPGVTPYGPIYLYAVPVARPPGRGAVEAGRA
ncbi:MAG: hypothetical protein IRY97_09640, partial [Thermomicrobiaceae bacterium]|nr:hypothetical protein [Thermomicrobiaceae bacterium]